MSPLIIVCVFLCVFVLFCTFTFCNSRFDTETVPALTPIFFTLTSFVTVPKKPIPIYLEPSISSVWFTFTLEITGLPVARIVFPSVIFVCPSANFAPLMSPDTISGVQRSSSLFEFTPSFDKSISRKMM